MSKNSLDKKQILLVEQADRRYVRAKKIYIDMINNLHAGLVLSEVVYWHLPSSKTGKSRLIQIDGQDWMAARRQSWWERSRLTAREFDRALDKLVNAKLLIKMHHEFKGQKSLHLRINWPVFTERYNEVLENQPRKAVKRRQLMPGLNDIWDILLTLLRDEPVPNPAQVSPIGEAEGVSPIGDTPLPDGYTPSPTGDTESPTGDTYTKIYTTQPISPEKEKESPASQEDQPDSTVPEFSPIGEFIEAEFERPKQPLIDPKKNPLQEAVCFAFKVKPGGWAGKLGNFLTGKAADKSKATAWGEHKISEPMTPAEIVAFRIWYRENPKYAEKEALPTTPQTLSDRVEEFRGSRSHDKYMARGEKKLNLLLKPTPPPKIEESVEASPEFVAQIDMAMDDLVQLAREKKRLS